MICITSDTLASYCLLLSTIARSQFNCLASALALTTPAYVWRDNIFVCHIFVYKISATNKCSIYIINRDIKILVFDLREDLWSTTSISILAIMLATTFADIGTLADLTTLSLS